MRKLSLLLLLLLLQLAMYGRGNTAPSLSQRPSSFIENKGQIRDQYGNPRTDIDFILQTQGMVLYIGKSQLHYQFIKENPKVTTHYTRENPPKHYQVSPGYTTYRLDVSLEGANASAEALKEGLQIAKYHYYNTAAPEGVAGVQSYSRITYKDVYPGIDWVLYIKDGKLKYDFVVHPGAKLSDIKLNYAGASAMSLTKDGSLQIATPLGDLNEDAPYSYEQGSKKFVTSHYLLNGNTVSVAAGAYKGVLVIDPEVDWGTYFGGESDEGVGSVATDNMGYVYITGSTFSTSNIATVGAYQETFEGLSDAFLAKFDSAGQLQWATYYGGSGISSWIAGFNGGAGIACDNMGHVYLAGGTTAENGIATPGSFQEELDPLTTGGFFTEMNGFLVQFDTEGIRHWGTYYGASAHATEFKAVTCDGQGNIFVSGLTDSSTSTTNQLITPGAYQTSYGGGGRDALLVKFDSSGSRQWATYFGGEDFEFDGSLTCDTSGNVYMAGSTYSLVGIASPNGYLQQIPAVGNNGYSYSDHGYVAKFSSNGILVWSTFINGEVKDLYLDPFSHLYVCGYTQAAGTDTTIVSPGCWQYFAQTVVGSPINGFLMSFDPINCTRNWGTYYNGTCYSSCNAITGDDRGNIFIAGYTCSADSLGFYPIATPDSYQDTMSELGFESFIAKFDTVGIRKWGTYYAGCQDESFGGTISLASSRGALYFNGYTNNASHVATPGAYQEVLNNNGNSDAGDVFLVRWLPVDISIKRESPALDTVCTGDIPLSVSVSNLGRMNDTGDVVITYLYSGPSEGGDTFTFTGSLPVGVTESYSLGTVPLDYEGVYDFTIYLHYTHDDDNRDNDTLHFSLTTSTAEPVANIEYSQIGTNYQFSDPDGLSSYTYHWGFGDGDTSSEATPTHSYAVSGTYDVTLIVTGWCGSDTAHLSLDAVGTGTGVSGIAGDNLLSVYPNPAKGDLYLKAAGLTMKRYEVVNALGQTMLNGTLNGQQDKINVSSLAAGAYYIRINTNKGMAEKPFQVLR